MVQVRFPSGLEIVGHALFYEFRFQHLYAWDPNQGYTKVDSIATCAQNDNAIIFHSRDPGSGSDEMYSHSFRYAEDRNHLKNPS